MSQTLGNGHTVHAVEVEHTSHCVPEGVSVDVWEAVALAEPGEPCGHAVRVHGAAGVLGKHKTLILVVFSQAQALPILPRSVLLQQLHGLRR